MHGNQPINDLPSQVKCLDRLDEYIRGTLNVFKTIFVGVDAD
jgi:hypothetical protein